MSRIGKLPIAIPAGVEVKVDGNTVTVKGPKDTLTTTVHPSMKVVVKDSEITVIRPDDDKDTKALHGLTRTLIFNMVEGVTNGYKKELEVNGVGYRAQMKGKDLVLNIGFSHPVVMTPPEGIKVEVPDANKIIVSGADKQMVGQFTAEIREKRPPEPYKGKGIKYVDEYVRRKEGKAGKGGK